MCLQRREQMGHRESQSIREADETQHGEIALAQLNGTDVPETQACSCGEGRLGKTLGLPGLADGRPKERQQNGLIVWTDVWHAVLSQSCISSPPMGERIARDGRGKSGVCVQPCEQPGRGNVQGTRKTEQRQHGNIAFACFDLADIRTAYARAGGESRLGQSPLLPVLTEGGPKTLQQCVLRSGRSRWRIAVCHHRIPSCVKG